jgi:prepilin-type N-terminal cleavage/methylation domain-containing protein
MLMFRHRHEGFTLIEILIVAGVVGLVLALGTPSYRDYDRRTKVLAVIEAMNACRRPITRAYHSGAVLPEPGQWGCENNLRKAPNVARVATDAQGGVIVTTKDIGGTADGVIVMRPSVANGNVTAWVCGGRGTSVPLKYLPGTCRG